MSLYVANPSKQHVVFNYRDPVNNLLAAVEIASGSQVEIGHAWNDVQTQNMIAQLERFGARDAAESHGNLGRFLGLLYRDSGVIEVDEIELAHAAVVDTQEKRSIAEATKSGLGFDRAARREAARRKRPPATMTEVSVHQEVAPHERPTGNEVAFSMSVDPVNGRNDVKLPLE